MQLAYVYKIDQGDDGGYTVTFPDVPEAITGTFDQSEIHALARDALLSALGIYIREKEAVPTPSTRKKGDGIVYLRPVEAAKVALYMAMSERSMSQVALADLLDKAPKIIQRWLDLHHNSKIEDINNALRLVFGKRLVTGLMDAA